MEVDEHEQGELVQKWLRQNGSPLITGIAMGLALVFGWQWWQGKGVRHQEEAATQYQAFVEAIDAKDAGKAKAFAALLADKYADTPYSNLATLRNAAFLSAGGKTDAAIKTLQDGKSKEKDPELAEIFTLRLARLLLADAALWILDEPVTNLDTAGIQLVEDLIVQHVEQGGMVIAAAHQRLLDDAACLRRLELEP